MFRGASLQRAADGRDEAERRGSDSAAGDTDWGELIARLSRFYPGISPIDWLERTPVAVLRAYLVMIPRLSGEESVRAANVVAVGSGTLERDDRRSLVASWTNHQRRDRRDTAPTDPTALASVGIGVRVVTKG